MFPSFFSVTDLEFHSELGTEILGGPSGDQRDWERGGDQWDGRRAEISETRQVSRWLASGGGASKFAIPELLG
jgi:hypothetical protein